MSGRPRPVIVLASAVIVLAGCAAGATPSPSVVPVAPSTPAASPSPAASPGLSPSPAASPVPSSPVDGVVIAVDSEGLTDVKGFTIRTDAGVELTFAIGLLEPGSLPAGHLTEHSATGAPVRVTFVVKDGELVALSFADAD